MMVMVKFLLFSVVLKASERKMHWSAAKMVLRERRERTVNSLNYVMLRPCPID